jgi:hypothetical protein
VAKRTLIEAMETTANDKEVEENEAATCQTASLEQIAELEAELKRLRSENELQEVCLEGGDNAVVAMKLGEIKALTAQVLAKDIELTAKASEIIEKDAAINVKDQQIAENDDALEANRVEIANINAILEPLQLAADEHAESERLRLERITQNAGKSKGWQDRLSRIVELSYLRKDHQAHREAVRILNEEAAAPLWKIPRIARLPV